MAHQFQRQRRKGLNLMLKENPIIAYTADCRESLSNCTYSTRTEIADEEIAKKTFLFDCVFAQYKGNYRTTPISSRKIQTGSL